MCMLHRSLRSISLRLQKLIIQILWNKKNHVALIWKIIIGSVVNLYMSRQLRAVVTCPVLWPDWVIRIVITTQRDFIRFQLWAYKPFIQWATDVFVCGRHICGTLCQKQVSKFTNTCCYVVGIMTMHIDVLAIFVSYLYACVYMYTCTGMWPERN